jgi:hypothetical protein
MSRYRYLIWISLISIALVASLAIAKDPTPVSSGRTTIGEFALKVIRMSEDDPVVRESITVEDALARLKAAGLKFKGGPDDPLTEGDRSAFYVSVANGLLDKVNPPPTGFGQCAELTTVPECLQCCKSLPGVNASKCGRACGRVHAGQQHASPSEPTP